MKNKLVHTTYGYLARHKESGVIDTELEWPRGSKHTDLTDEYENVFIKIEFTEIKEGKNHEKSS